MDSNTENDGEQFEDGGQQDVPLAWGKVGGNEPPPPPPPASARPSVEPPEVVQPWAEQAAAANPLRNPPTPSLGQSIGATPPAPPHMSPPAPPHVPPPVPPHVPPVVSPPMPPNAGAATVVSSAAEPVLSSDFGVTPPPVAPDVSSSGGSKLPWIAALVGALMLLGGGGFFALTAFTSSGGASTPEEAVDSMFEALGNEDFVTLGELIEPSERRTIVEPSITELLPELQRLGILSNEADAGGVEGIDLEFTDLTYRVERIADNPDMVHVYLTGGEFASEFNSAEFPFTDEYREILGSDLQDEPREVESIQETDPLTFVERDGRWYFSGWFTIAEIARLDEGARLPLASEAPPALGSASPEAAVEAMMAEIVELDMAGMIGRMDPGELAALYRYAPLFLEDGQAGLDEARQFLNDENVVWDIRDFDFDVDTDGDDAIVEIRGFTFEVTAPQLDLSITYGREALSATVIADQGRGSFEATPTRWVIEGVVEGESFNIEILIDPEAGTVTGTGTVAGESGNGELVFDETGVCSRYSINIAGESETGCLEENVAGDEVELISNYETVFEQWPTEFPGIAISTRQTDGEWYVSPISTMFDGMLSVLSGFEEGQLQELTDSGMGLDPLSGAGELSGMIEDVVESSMGNDDVTEAVTDFDDFEEFDEPLSGPAVVDSSIAFTVDRGATAELSDSISVGTYDSATLDLEAGDTVIITMSADSGSLDPHLTLVFQDSGNTVGVNDDADFEADLPSSFDSQLEVVVADTGTYEIRIGSYEDGSGGDYNLSVARS